MEQNKRIVIVGAGVFGLSSALELKNRGYKKVIVLDRNFPPVPDGSSTDISRIIRFDYGDPIYARIAKEAYDVWSSSPLLKEVFFDSPFILASTEDAGRSYIDKCTAFLDQHNLPWKRCHSLKESQELSTIATPNSEFYGYRNDQAGWTDAQKAMTVLRDLCLEAGVSFLCGPSGTVTTLINDRATGQIRAAETESGHMIEGDLFILSTGAWTSRLVPMYNTILATAQVLGFIKLSQSEVEKYSQLPIYINFDSGWFCFPPHPETNLLKVAVHGWGYTRSPLDVSEVPNPESGLSLPPMRARSQRMNFTPMDGSQRLSKGFSHILPELTSRPFERTALCWYTDTPTGDFILDYHPDFKNVFLATGGSGHAFKFLPVLGNYAVDAMERKLTLELRDKWQFRLEYKNTYDAFKGDGSRGGPERRELTPQERSKL